MGALAKKGRDRVEEPVHPVLSEDNLTVRRLLGGDQPDRPIPSLLELLRPSMKVVLRPSTPLPSGWNIYHSKLVPDR